MRGDVQAWLVPSLAAVFGEALVPELEALAERAPVDLRINTLKATRDKAMASLAHLSPEPSARAPHGLRLPLGADGRGPALVGEPAFVKGLVEVQDEGSQLAVALARPRPGEQVLDLCAGAGGKTLALAAAMENRGQVYAADTDGRRLAGLHPRLDKSGARNIQVRAPRRGVPPIADLAGRCDLVLVDAPCTGTGTWRRKPGRQMAGAARRAGAAAQGAGRGVEGGGARGQARRAARLRHLFVAGGGERGPHPRLPCRPSRLRVGAGSGSGDCGGPAGAGRSGRSFGASA